MAVDVSEMPSRTALVLYGTETGTSQDLAFEASRILERMRFEADAQEFDDILPQTLSAYDLVVFVVATTGQGEFPSNARKFWTSLLRKKLTASFLRGVEYALVGLGDTSYPKFNWAARKLHKRLQQLGASSLMAPCEADEQGEDSTDGAFITWSVLFKSMLMSNFPLPTGVEPISDDETLESKWTLAPYLKQGNPVNGIAFKSSIGPMLSTETKLKLTLARNERATPFDHWQDVRFMSFQADTSSEYLPGDAIAIQPQNMPEDVQSLIKLMKWEDVADERLCIHHNRGSSRVPHQLANQIPTESPFTLRRLLQNQLDINAIPRRSFFAAIAHFTDNDMHKERLLEFTDPQYLDEYYDYATRPRRSIMEILQEFDSVRIPWQEAINVFPILRPRQFSIASGGLLKQGGACFELLVAIVKYKTVIKRIREGVCTRYLAQLPLGTTIEGTLKTEGRLHSPAQLQQTHHLLIGAGTGIAPLRAIIHEKADHQSSGSNTLIFGSRNANADYFFKEEWKKLTQKRKGDTKPLLNVITAFSRDQKQKVYVQDQITTYSAEIQELLIKLNATVVVCGSSGQMPKAVRQALVEVLSKHKELANIDEAEKLLVQMEKTGRYKQETW